MRVNRSCRREMRCRSEEHEAHRTYLQIALGDVVVKVFHTDLGQGWSTATPVSILRYLDSKTPTEST